MTYILQIHSKYGIMDEIKSKAGTYLLVLMLGKFGNALFSGS